MKIVGIDLGTTYSAVAVIGEDGKPVILDNQDGEKTTPSVVLFSDFGDGDEPLVGTQAKNQAAVSPADVVQYVKRNIGNQAWVFDSSSGEQYSAEEVSAIILKRLKEGAELALGEKVSKAVITVPAYFDDARRVATRNAGEIAGLEVVRILNEPTAAALSYGLEAEEDGKFLVYDLGGGTFDVTLMEITNGNFNVLATDGDRNLGGFDFDNAIMQIVLNELRENHGMSEDDLYDEDLTAQIRERAELAKRALTSVENTQLTFSVGKKAVRIPLSREQFEEATLGLMNRTIEITEDVLHDANLTFDDIDNILLVGGSTRMPIVKKRLEELYGKELKYHVNPDEAVALGAAVQAAIEESNSDDTSMDEGRKEVLDNVTSNINISDVTSQSLGVVTKVRGTNTEKNSIVIERNTNIPCKKEIELATVDETDSVRFRVTEGDDEDVNYVTVIGEAVIKFDRVVPKDYPFKLVYSYDIDQTIFGEVYHLQTGELAGTFEVVRESSLSSEQVEMYREKIDGIKII